MNMDTTQQTDVYGYYLQLWGVDALLNQIVILVMVFIGFIILLLWFNPKIKKKTMIILTPCLIFFGFVSSIYIADGLVASLLRKRAVFRRQKYSLEALLSLYYKKFKHYPPYEGLLDSLYSFAPLSYRQEFMNPYTKSKFRKVLPFDSVMSGDYSLSADDIGLFAYKVSEDGESCAFYFVDYDTWVFRPVFLVKGYYR